MPSCISCGSYIPGPERNCSMCYGDPYYGRDGYYLAWLEEQRRQEEEKEQKLQDIYDEWYDDVHKWGSD